MAAWAWGGKHRAGVSDEVRREKSHDRSRRRRRGADKVPVWYGNQVTNAATAGFCAVHTHVHADAHADAHAPGGQRVLL